MMASRILGLGSLPLSLTLVEAACSGVVICVLATIAVMQEVVFIAKGHVLIP